MLQHQIQMHGVSDSLFLELARWNSRLCRVSEATDVNNCREKKKLSGSTLLVGCPAGQELSASNSGISLFAMKAYTKYREGAEKRDEVSRHKGCQYIMYV